MQKFRNIKLKTTAEQENILIELYGTPSQPKYIILGKYKWIRFKQDYFLRKKRELLFDAYRSDLVYKFDEKEDTSDIKSSIWLKSIILIKNYYI